MINYIILILVNILIIFTNLLFLISEEKRKNLSHIFILSILFWSFQISITGIFLGWIIKFIDQNTWIPLNLFISFLLYLRYKKNLPNLINFIKNEVNSAFSIVKSSKSYFLYFVILLLFIEVSDNLIRVIYYPEIVWDSWVYQMHPIVDWYQNKKFDVIYSPNSWVNEEILGPKIIGLWFVTILGNSELIDAHQFISTLLLILLIYNLLKKLKVNFKYRILGSALVYNIPIILIQSHTSQEHITLSYYYLLSFYLLFDFLKFKSIISYLALVISLSLTLTSKTVGIMYIPLFFLTFFFSSPKRILYFFEDIFFSPKKIIFSIFIVSSLVSFWIFRNYYGLYQLTYGNSGVSTAISNSSNNIPFYEVYMTSLSYNFSEFRFRILDNQYFYEPNSQNISNFGIFFFSFYLLTYLIIFYRLIIGKLNFELKTLLFASLILQLVYFSFYGGLWNYRLFSFTPIIGTIFFINFLSEKKQNQVITKVFEFLIVIGMMFNYLAVHNSEDGNLETRYWFRKYLNQDERTPIAYSDKLATHSSWKFINYYLPASEKIAYIANQDAWVYLYFDNNLKRKIMFVDPSWYTYTSDHSIEIKEGLAEKLKQEGYSILHIRYNNWIYLDIDSKGFKRIDQGLYYIE